MVRRTLELNEENHTSRERYYQELLKQFEERQRRSFGREDDTHERKRWVDYYEGDDEGDGRRTGMESHRVLTGEGALVTVQVDADSRDIARFSFEDSRCVCESRQRSLILEHA